MGQDKTATPVRFTLMEDHEEVHIATNIRRLEKQLNERWEHWEGTRQEFERWAEGAMESRLYALASQMPKSLGRQRMTLVKEESADGR